MSNILVTGGLGFIGSNFISKIIDKENFVVNIDLETYDLNLTPYKKSENSHIYSDELFTSQIISNLKEKKN